ncbi:MAG: glycerol-3-phosphate 1-O-acyltransferase PlsY [Planctomycetes bacterium]|nr:glycerol-3-phosphate 1-O-acyltransferase PlsY [Planctomycetota bacterium]
MIEIIGVIASYFIGAIPFGYVVVKAIKGVDVREYGSKNIGATNAARVLGWPFFIVVFSLDFAKGFVPCLLIARHVGQPSWGTPSPHVVTILCGLFAICGHIWPIYMGFKGGKAVAAAAGVFFWIAPKAAGVALAAFAIVFLTFRYVSLGSICASAALIAAAVWFEPNRTGKGLPLLVFCALVALLVIVRHKTNIQRLLAGTESRVRFGGKRKGGTGGGIPTQGSSQSQ